MLTLVKYQERLNLPYQHDVVTLEKGGYPFARIQAKKLGMRHSAAPDAPALRRLIAQADITHMHFYFSPSQYLFLRSAWPPERRIIWYTVSGEHAPQCLSRQLVESADQFVATSPLTLELPQVREMGERMCVISPTADFERLVPLKRHAQEQFTIGFMGTVNFAKLHPDYARMCSEIAVPDSHFVVCGGDNQTLKEQLQALGIRNRFSFRGFVEDVRSPLATFDVFGYPLAPQTSATGEIALQEAMAAAVPPVVFPYGGVKFTVENGRTGIVVQTPEAYSEAISDLYHHPQERRRLGQNAQAFVRDTFDPLKTAGAFDQQYQNLMEQPKRPHPWPSQETLSGPAAFFAESVRPCAPYFSQSLQRPNPTAEQQIMQSSLILSSSEGGLIHFRNTYPKDPHLRFWSALAHLGLNKKEPAQKEFQTALELGLDPAYCAPYLY